MQSGAIRAPSIVSAVGSIKAEQLTCAIGAELSNINIGVASRSPELLAEIHGLLLQHKVLFFRDQDIDRAEHVAFARHFGELEDHPVAGSDPEWKPNSVAFWDNRSTQHYAVMDYAPCHYKLERVGILGDATF